MIVPNTEQSCPFVNPKLLSRFLKFQMRSSKANWYLEALVVQMFLFACLCVPQAFNHSKAEALQLQNAAIIGNHCGSQACKLLGGRGC